MLKTPQVTIIVVVKQCIDYDWFKFIDLVQIQNCDNLTDISGLDNLVFAGTVFLVELPMTEIVSFKKLFEVSDLWIYNDKVKRE